MDPKLNRAIIQDEVIEIIDKKIDPVTGEILDETKIDITPKVEEPLVISTTLGGLKLDLESLITAKQALDDRYSIDTKYFDEQISTLETQISKIK